MQCIMLLLCISLILCLPGCAFADARKEAGENTERISVLSDTNEAEEETTFVLEVRVLDVGQGLSVLVGLDGNYLLYDGGGSDYSSYVVAYLKENDIGTLSYLIASHYDADHISGLVGVLNTTTVGTVLTPDYETDSYIYQSFRSMLERNGAPEIHPSAGDVYMLGSAEIQVIGPKSYSYEDENDNSIVIRIVYEDFSCILTGDAGEEAEADLLASEYTLDSDVYIAGHHGSSTSSSESFVNAISPDCVIISAGAGNSYGHPTEKTLSTLKYAGAALYRTDVQGEIICYSDGTDCWFNVDSSDNWLSGSEISVDETAEADTDIFIDETTGADTDISIDETTEAGTDILEGASVAEGSSEQREYVLNTRTMKFHYPDCSSVSKMSDANKKTVTAGREELIDEGYSPCGNCNP
ncbi:MAG: MBL fold metallo-hydrolase [Lachnospiraceae bacterium]|nr:MBL fold metallo-hydrolase [Lachnospiraceae bacterium]